MIPPAWPQPKKLPVPARTVGLRRVYNNPSELGDAINAACADFPGASEILSLDFHNVADRNRDSFLRALRWLEERPEYLLVICSKCSTQSLIDAACAYWLSCLSEVQFHRSVPAFFILGKDKCAQLWRATRYSVLSNSPLVHIDDKPDIVRPFVRFQGSTPSWTGLTLAVWDRVELDQLE